MRVAVWVRSALAAASPRSGAPDLTSSNRRATRGIRVVSPARLKIAYISRKDGAEPFTREGAFVFSRRERRGRGVCSHAESEEEFARSGKRRMPPAAKPRGGILGESGAWWRGASMRNVECALLNGWEKGVCQTSGKVKSGGRGIVWRAARIAGSKAGRDSFATSQTMPKSICP